MKRPMSATYRFPGGTPATERGDSRALLFESGFHAVASPPLRGVTSVSAQPILGGSPPGIAAPTVLPALDVFLVAIAGTRVLARGSRVRTA
jgi:hypothetical protein